MMRSLLAALVVLTALLLAACAPSGEAIRAAVEATAAAMPTDEPTATVPPSPTPTTEPTAAPSPTDEPTAEPTATAEPPTLEEIILDANDALPPPLLPDFTHDEPPYIRQDVLGELDPAPGYIMQELYHPDNDFTGGAVAVYLYDGTHPVGGAWNHVTGQLDGMGYDLGVSYPEGVGERAKMQELQESIYLAFTRCRAFVFLWTVGARPFDVVNYAATLDELMGPAACEE